MSFFYDIVPAANPSKLSLWGSCSNSSSIGKLLLDVLPPIFFYFIGKPFWQLSWEQHFNVCHLYKGRFTCCNPLADVKTN